MCTWRIFRKYWKVRLKNNKKCSYWESNSRHASRWVWPQPTIPPMPNFEIRFFFRWFKVLICTVLYFAYLVKGVLSILTSWRIGLLETFFVCATHTYATLLWGFAVALLKQPRSGSFGFFFLSRNKSSKNYSSQVQEHAWIIFSFFCFLFFHACSLYMLWNLCITKKRKF